MKLSTLIRWGGPVAIVSGVFTMFSDLLGLTIHVPGLGEAANTGYQAVGSGVILFALTLLVIGMVGLYATQPRPGAPRVIEYGDGHARYVLVESDEPHPAQPLEEIGSVLQRDAARAARLDGAAVRRHRAAPLQTRRA